MSKPLKPSATVVIKQTGSGQSNKKKSTIVNLDQQHAYVWLVPENYKKDICDLWLGYCCKRRNCTFAHGYADMSMNVSPCFDITNCEYALDYSCPYRHDVKNFEGFI